MSRFSGRCDFYDEIETLGLDAILNAQVYVGNRRIHLRNQRDCVPYYPYLINGCYWNHKDGCTIIELSHKSWLEIEAELYGNLPHHATCYKALMEEWERVNRADV